MQGAGGPGGASHPFAAHADWALPVMLRIITCLHAGELRGWVGACVCLCLGLPARRWVGGVFCCVRGWVGAG